MNKDKYCYKNETADPFEYDLLKAFSRANRIAPTDAEYVLWRYLRNRQLGVKIRRQHVIGEFIADFVCIEKQLIIEVDGEYHFSPEQKEEDSRRSQILQSLGYNVIRFTNEEVLFNIEHVICVIKERLSLPPLRSERGGISNENIDTIIL